MMSIEISPEAERIKNTILDMFDAGKMDPFTFMEALYASVVEFAGRLMDESADHTETASEVVQKP